MGNTDLLFANEPMAHWHKDDFNAFLKWAVDQDSSDITLLPNSPVWIRRHGVWLGVTQRQVTSDEILYLVDELSGNPAGSATLKGGKDLDFAYEYKVDRFKTLRFRGSATACKDGYSEGAEVTLRSIPDIPPLLKDLNVEPAIWKNAFPNNGLVLVTGVMGTGKSTLLSSMIRQIRETDPRKIGTYESPIEFNLMDIPGAIGPCTQSSVPEHLESFEVSIRNAVRRAIDVLLVGEARDKETLRAMMEASEVGVCAYSTVHTRNVPETPTRIINKFAPEDQNQIASTLLPSLRMIIQQRLLPKVGGGRVPIREFLAFNYEHRQQLMKTRKEDLVPLLQEFVLKDGQKLSIDAKNKYEAGLISKESYEAIKYEQEMEVNVA